MKIDLLDITAVCYCTAVADQSHTHTMYMYTLQLFAKGQAKEAQWQTTAALSLAENHQYDSNRLQ